MLKTIWKYLPVLILFGICFDLLVTATSGATTKPCPTQPQQGHNCPFIEGHGDGYCPPIPVGKPPCPTTTTTTIPPVTSTTLPPAPVVVQGPTGPQGPSGAPGATTVIYESAPSPIVGNVNTLLVKWTKAHGKAELVKFQDTWGVSQSKPTYLMVTWWNFNAKHYSRGQTLKVSLTHVITVNKNQAIKARAYIKTATGVVPSNVVVVTN